MKEIHFSIVNLSLFREKLGKKPELEVPEYSTLFDIIAEFDQRLHSEIFPSLSENEKKRILLFKNCTSLLQTLWNPEIQKPYKDVMIEARECFSSRINLPVMDNLDYILPNQAYIAVGPDEG